MNNKIQNIFIALIVTSLLALGGGMYVMSQRLSSVAMMVKSLERELALSNSVPAPIQPSIPVTAPPTIQQTTIATVNNCMQNSQEVGAYIGLCFDYPSGWVLASYANEFTPQQKDLRITSEPGRLFSAESSGGPGEPGVTYFQNGYQLNIMAVRLGAIDELLGTKVKGYSFLYHPAQPCQEVGCPTERYFFRPGDLGTIFEVDVNYKGVTATEARSYLDTILKSLSEGP